ncbi:hypothetical protein [Ferrimonas balearica]|uniref:hypothetical protein n=1 Tax=Ferrimonas balearica TaxID=44012 RepID=UPI001C9A032B|nr:hypothetical protein [Ferrimonas balearica]MBY5991736.1 hypothetical protein [Ferrimonas balearica]
MTAISARHRHFLLIEQGVVPAVFNFFINGLIVWALFRTEESIPLWGESSIGLDLLLTAFLLPFLTCVIVSAIVSRQLDAGKIPPLPLEQFPMTGWYRRSSSVRGLFLGTVCVIFAAIPVVWALYLGQAKPFYVSSFIAFKAVWAALLAIVVTPIVGWWALASASRSHMT